MIQNTLTDHIFTKEEVLTEFIKIYGQNDSQLRIFSSPARINIIGEHIDYNGGKVFPSAIDRYLFIAIRKRKDTKIIYNDIRFSGTYNFDIKDNFFYKKENDYTNYLNGIIKQLKEKKYIFECGFECLIASNIPAGGGISSSSALECGFAYAVKTLFNFNIECQQIAELGQMSEHNFMNVQCGIMDQFIIAMAKKDTAILLDCNNLNYQYIPLNLKDCNFVVMNTNKVRRLQDSKYNERRSECEKSLKLLQDAGFKINYLCELKEEDFTKAEKILKEENLIKRTRHCITENLRVKKAVEALKENNLEKIGKLLCQSHLSLKNDYEVTGLELDTLAFCAQKQKGCLGARMTGAGFGGCAIALVKKENTQSFIENVQEEYTKTVGYKAGFFACNSGDGVKEI